MSRPHDCSRATFNGKTAPEWMHEVAALTDELAAAKATLQAWDDLPSQVADLTEMLKEAEADKRELARLRAAGADATILLLAHALGWDTIPEPGGDQP